MNAALPRDMLLHGVGSKGSTIGVVPSVGSIERGNSLAENLCGDYAWRTIVKAEIFEEEGISGARRTSCSVRVYKPGREPGMIQRS
jgi:hypothetical protein